MIPGFRARRGDHGLISLGGYGPEAGGELDWQKEIGTASDEAALDCAGGVIGPAGA